MSQTGGTPARRVPCFYAPAEKHADRTTQRAGTRRRSIRTGSPNSSQAEAWQPTPTSVAARRLKVPPPVSSRGEQPPACQSPHPSQLRAGGVARPRRNSGASVTVGHPRFRRVKPPVFARASLKGAWRPSARHADPPGRAENADRARVGPGARPGKRPTLSARGASRRLDALLDSLARDRFHRAVAPFARTPAPPAAAPRRRSHATQLLGPLTRRTRIRNY